MRSILIALALAGCTFSGAPVELDLSGKELCASCRMAIVDVRTAAQWVARGEEPRFFDDLGCLRSYLADSKSPTKGKVYVADHRTKVWVPLAQAIYARQPALETPMASHLLAHADAASRAADPAARGTTPLTATDVFGATASGLGH